MQADDPEANEESLTNRRVAVTLICAPALAKRGTSEGDSYDKSVVICNAAVDCFHPTTTRGLGGGAGGGGSGGGGGGGGGGALAVMW